MSLCCVRRQEKKEKPEEKEKKKEKQSKKNKKKQRGSGSHSEEQEEETSSSVKRVVSPPEVNGNQEQQLLYSFPVEIEQLNDYVKDVAKLRRNHEMLPRGQMFSWKRASDPLVADKNRYAKVLPYDSTRVVLPSVSDQPGSDYINASYVDGYGRVRGYIAAQGPKENTCSDFWRMVWEENVAKIVMLTNLIEVGKRKCELYWPDSPSSSVVHGDVTVTNDGVEMMADYCVRTFLLTHKNRHQHGTKRYVKQFHFTSWPDHGVPLHPCTLVAFLKKIKAHDVPSSGPVVVHCSAGLGRTGTVILLDSMLDMGRVEGRVDAVRHLHRMRIARANILDNFDQFELVHKALVEALLGEETSIPCPKFAAAYERLWKHVVASSTSSSSSSGNVNSKKNETRMQRQFDTLAESRGILKPETCRTALDASNVGKNRIPEIIPEERHRPFLKTNSTFTGDYINAVYVSGYHSKDAYLATQFPLPETVVDFWRLVADHNCSTIVVLNDLDYDGAETDRVVPFWPEEDEPLSFPFMSVHSSSVSSERDAIIRHFQFLHKNRNVEQIRQICLVQLRGWFHKQAIPPSAERLLKLLDHVTEGHKTSAPPGNVLVTCFDGSTACGLFCAASFVCDKIQTEQEVDVFLAARNVIGTRPTFLSSLEQYAFCHEVALAYLNSFQTYSNFR